MLDALINKTLSAAQGLKIKSALNPMLWLCGLITVPFLWFMYALLNKNQIIFASILLVIVTIPILSCCGVFIYFAINKPEKLQSEEYQIKHETLQVIQIKSGDLTLTPTSLNVLIDNTGQVSSKHLS